MSATNLNCKGISIFIHVLTYSWVDMKSIAILRMKSNGRVSVCPFKTMCSLSV